jgi:hypothetical protein
MRFVELNPVEDLEFGDYNNKKIAVCMALTKKPPKFQIPRMYMPFGISGFSPAYGPTKYNIDFSMKGWDEEGNYVRRFYEFVRSMENQLIDSVVERSQEIFGSQLSKKEIHGMLNSNIKESGDREPKFRLKIDSNTKIFDVNDVDVTCDLENGLHARQSGAWKTTQLKIYEPQRLKGFQFNLGE